MNLFDGYWPWWLGASALATMGLLHYVATGRAFALSSVFEQIPGWFRGSRGQEATAGELSVGGQVLFVVGVILGGLLSAWGAGTLAPRFNLGELSMVFLGDGVGMWSALLGGGVMIGFGTRMLGGCTSGHGLSGCSRLEPGSLLGTCIFCAAAVGTAFAMQALWAN